MNGQLDRYSEDEVVAQWFENSYGCSECGITRKDEWSCMCDDRCPTCNAETEPTSSIDLSRPLAHEDYIGAARLIRRGLGDLSITASAEDAKAYAEAILEGGEIRFESPKRKRAQA